MGLKISEMPIAEEVNEEDLIPIVQNGANKVALAKNIGTGGGNASGDTLPIGSIVEWSAYEAPENWLICMGQDISRTDYSELFKVIGTTYGEGDGTTTFRLPDLRKRVPVGYDDTDTDFNALGKTGGSKEMQKHNHQSVANDNYAKALSTTTAYAEGFSAEGNINYRRKANMSSYVTGYAGEGTSGNLQPYITVNYIIKAKQSAGVVATVVDSLESTSQIDALSANMGSQLSEKIDNKFMYSTEEKAIGKWIDGSTIYRKVLVITSGFKEEMEVAHNVVNFDKLINSYGVLYWGNAGEKRLFPTIYPRNIADFGASIYDYTSTIVRLELGKYMSNYVTKIEIVIEYTKNQK